MNGETKFFVAGIASYGVNVAQNDYYYGCGSNNIPVSYVVFFMSIIKPQRFRVYLLFFIIYSIYTRVSSYTDWISAQINNGQTTPAQTTISTSLAPVNQCGRTFIAPNARITGGSTAIVIRFFLDFVYFNYCY